MTSILSFSVMVCCAIESAQPPEARGSATVLGMAEERLLVLKLGIWPNQQVSPTAYEKIRPGMTEGEIEKMLGIPARVQTVPFHIAVSTPMGYRDVLVEKKSTWVGVDQVIEISFGKKRTVELSHLRPLKEWASVDCHFDIRTVFQQIQDLLRP